MMLIGQLSFDLHAAPRGCVYDQGKLGTCLISFGDLWSDRDAYAGLPVAISGYLVSGPDGLFLFPGKDYFTYQLGRGAIKIDDSDVRRDEVRKNLTELPDADDWHCEVSRPVVVIGTYNPESVGGFASLGTIRADDEGLFVSYEKPVMPTGVEVKDR